MLGNLKQLLSSAWILLRGWFIIKERNRRALNNNLSKANFEWIKSTQWLIYSAQGFKTCKYFIIWQISTSCMQISWFWICKTSRSWNNGLIDGWNSFVYGSWSNNRLKIQREGGHMKSGMHCFWVNTWIKNFW